MSSPSAENGSISNVVFCCTHNLISGNVLMNDQAELPEVFYASGQHLRLAAVDSHTIWLLTFAVLHDPVALYAIMIESFLLSGEDSGIYC
jgi:hypothetical protein